MTEKKVHGRPKFLITPQILEEVGILSGRGLTQVQLFNYYGVPESSWYEAVKKNPLLKQAITQGKARTISTVVSKLMDQVRNGNMTAIIFYLKTQARWSEVNPPDDWEKLEKPKTPALTLTVNDPVEAARIYQQIMGGL